MNEQQQLGRRFVKLAFKKVSQAHYG